MRGARYLRLAAAAAFVALSAWTLASLYARDSAPKTVTAELSEFEKTVTLTGVVIRSETVVTGSPNADIAAATGDRLLGGQKIADGIYAPCAGVFSSLVDGYEGLTPENFEDYSPSVPDGALGRIVSGGWFFRADSAQSDLFRPGRNVELRLPERCRGSVVYADGKTVLIRCREGLDEVINARKLSIDVTLSQSRGIKVPASALHTGPDGAFVYVLRAGERTKCEVEIIFSGDGWSLVKEDRLRRGMEILI